ncbi:MAG: 50S ribosomal protein L11 methyltransferase [Wolinella sp.]
MCELYHELRVYPSGYFELFADFLVDSTSEAIEEIEDKENGCGIVVHSEKELDSLAESLHAFAATLSQRVGEEVGFKHELAWRRNEDWIENYKHSVQPIECAPFYIRPSWHHPKDTLVDILIDPALAFGSGHHATTYSCLRMLGALELEGLRVLDVGCGSGILSIAALKKGAQVESCDTDEFALSETLKNATLNATLPAKSWIGSIDEASGEYDLVVANIVATVIISLASQFHKRLKYGGWLILSGILDSSKDQILQRFSDFTLEEELLQEEWVTLRLRK